jgi:hypothetical protein
MQGLVVEDDRDLPHHGTRNQAESGAVRVKSDTLPEGAHGTTRLESVLLRRGNGCCLSRGLRSNSGRLSSPSKQSIGCVFVVPVACITNR